jgi:hypothetical protein
VCAEWCAPPPPALLPRAGVRAVESQYKLQTYIRIAMLYLEDDDPVSAETFIKKASSLIAGVWLRCARGGACACARARVQGLVWPRQGSGADARGCHRAALRFCAAAATACSLQLQPMLSRHTHTHRHKDDVTRATSHPQAARTLCLSCSTRPATHASWTPSGGEWSWTRHTQGSEGGEAASEGRSAAVAAVAGSRQGCPHTAVLERRPSAAADWRQTRRRLCH